MVIRSPRRFSSRVLVEERCGLVVERKVEGLGGRDALVHDGLDNRARP